MWNTGFVRSLLIRDVGGVRVPRPPEDPAERANEERHFLDKAMSRAALVAALDWIGIILLFVFREKGRELLPAVASPDLVFTLGILLIAAHSGFRLGQLEKYRAVSEAVQEIEGRDDS